MNKIIFAFMALGFLVSCTSTSVVSSWKNPTTTISASQIDKILFIALVKNETNRRAIEDELVTFSKGKGLASYLRIKSSELSNIKQENITRQLQTEGFDLVVIMSLKDVQNESRYVPGPRNNGLGHGGGFGYWGGFNSAVPQFNNPGFFVTDRNYLVETSVFSVVPNKLLWSGITSSINPGKVETSTREIANAVIEQMKKDGFLLK